MKIISWSRWIWVALAGLAMPLWGQEIQKLLLHAQGSPTSVEMFFSADQRFEMHITQRSVGISSAPQAAGEVLRGSAKRVADRLELSVDGRSIGYVQLWSGSGQIQAQLYWGAQEAPRAFFGAAFR